MSDSAWELDQDYPVVSNEGHAADAVQNLRIVRGLGSLAGPADVSLPDEAYYPPYDFAGSVQPPTTLDVQVVKRLLDKHNNSTPDIRTAQLLTYAWNAGSIIERNVAGHTHLLAYLTDNPGDWYHANRDIVEEILAAKRSRKNPGKYPQIMDAMDLVELTRHFDNTPFLRNAMRIKRESWSNYEGVHVEAAARLIMYEAGQAYLDDIQR